MALRKEEFHHDDEQQEAKAMKRSRITIDISPELRRRIKVAASQRDVSISEYLGQILEENVPDEMNLVEQDVHPVPSDILQEVDRIRERVIRESKGHIFEDSTEVLRQQREERTQYLEDLREQS
jgi:predicted metal-dependent RNase